MSNKVRVFNGFVPNAFPAKHQTGAMMEDWLEKLREAVPDLVHFKTDRVENTWAYNDVVLPVTMRSSRAVLSADHPNEPSDRYNTPNDAVLSQCVLHERFAWLARAREIYPDVDTWVWLEPTIFKQSGITRERVEQFVRYVTDNPVDAISLPGIWHKQPIQDHINHWRFAGSCWVCPAKYAYQVWDAAVTLVKLRTGLTNRLCWDNSTWSYIELLNVLPIRWYPGNHDETQLTGYLTGIDQWKSA